MALFILADCNGRSRRSIHKIGVCLVGSRSLFDEDGRARTTRSSTLARVGSEPHLRNPLQADGVRRPPLGDKTPFNILDIRVLEPIFPAAQYIHVVRDPRAVALSYVKAARTSPGIREGTFAKSAQRWNESVQNARGLSARVGNRRYSEVRYEDLVRAPEKELHKICQFLGQTYTPSMLSFQEGASKLGDVPAHAHHAKVKEPLDPSRCEGWANEISPSDRKTVDEITSGYRRLFGYQ